MHPLQSKDWGKFREKTGIKVIYASNFLVTIHKIPKTNYFIGYIPKCHEINKKMLDEILEIGKKEKCIFIQIEPNIIKTNHSEYKFENLYPSAHPLFTNFTFILDISKPEEELLKNMNQKTRYNIKLAQKKGVKVFEDNKDSSFNEYLELTKETTTRQKFFAHTKNYHKTMWETLRSNSKAFVDKDHLSAHLLKAVYNSKTLAAWILFVYKDTLYYPYGASSSLHREVMASNLIMWEAIKFGKKLGLKKFDMWGALGPNANPKDNWYGFHKFKQGYGGELTEFVGSYDLVIDKKLYFIYKIADKLRWFFLRIK